MDDDVLGKLFGLDQRGIKAGDAAGEFGAVRITNPNNLVLEKRSFAFRDPGQKQALPCFTKCALGAGIDLKRPFGLMKESNPAFAAG